MGIRSWTSERPEIVSTNTTVFVLARTRFNDILTPYERSPQHWVLDEKTFNFSVSMWDLLQQYTLPATTEKAIERWRMSYVSVNGSYIFSAQTD